MNLPLGYRYAAAYAGIRKQRENDIGLITSEPLAHAAGVFTTNRVQAAPVRIAREHLRSSSGRVAALLVNAGNANCATRTGEHVAVASCKAVAKALRVKRQQVLPASTGVIGVELDAKLLTAAIPGLVSNLSPAAFEAVAGAILTTDTCIKVASEELRFRGGLVRVAGMTKGAGMIHPNMATTLGFVMTDAALTAKELRSILQSATERSYHSLSIDGDMSTNDMIVLLANGASQIRPSANERDAVQRVVTAVMENLAEQIAADGEGARKLIVIRALGFKTADQARNIARSIANSLLVKTAIAGSDPNWGRILSAAGYAGVEFDPAKVDIYLQNVLVCRRGMAAEFDEAQLKRRLDDRHIEIRFVLNGRGHAEARFFTCDLTERYIQINASYRT